MQKKEMGTGFGFKEWLVVSEIVHPSHLDTSDIELEKQDGVYKYSFEYGGAQYHVSMMRFTLDDFEMIRGHGVGIDLPRNLVNYSITFRGPRGYSLTGVAGSGAVIVYSKMLSAIKKLMELEKVDMFTFSASDRLTIPTYERFVKTLLKDYTQIEEYTYLRTDILNSVLQASPEQARESMLKRIKGAQDERQSEIRDILEKKKFRRLLSIKDKIIGKVTGYGSGSSRVSPAVITSLEAPADGGVRVGLLVIGDKGDSDIQVTQVYAKESDLRDPASIDQNLLSRFIKLKGASGFGTQDNAGSMFYKFSESGA